ncbi:MAG: DUF2764 family protein [Bacteroidales bacterium]|jgi:hypothetical protein
MFVRNYYYLVAGLPDLVLDHKKLPVALAEFREELGHQLHPDDLQLLKLLFLPADNTNLLNLLEKNNKPFDETGNFTQHELEQEIKEPSDSPEYMQRFIQAFKEDSPVFAGYSWENQLTWLYYDYILGMDNDFLKEWFSFNLHLNNILTAFNVRKYKLSRENAYIGENTITEALKKSTLKDFGLSADFSHIETLLTIDESDNLLEKEKSVDMLRWDILDELNTFHYFTIEVLLAFIIKLFMVERWLQLDPETGKQLFIKLITDLEKSYAHSK